MYISSFIESRISVIVKNSLCYLNDRRAKDFVFKNVK